MKLSITIIGHNEEYHLRELLPGIAWADEIIYVDCESGDKSLEAASQHKCLIFSRPNNPNLNVNKSYAMEQSTGDWIFYLDPDERIPETLKAEILSVINSDSPCSAYELARRNHYFGKWLKHGSRYPDTQLRLFKRGAAEFPNKHVHEKLKVNGKIGRLKNDMHHFPFLSVSQFFVKIDFYATFEANFLYKNGTRINFRNSIRYCLTSPLSRFIRRYFFKLGFLDGLPGLFACLFDGLKFIIAYIKIWEMSKKP